LKITSGEAMSGAAVNSFNWMNAKAKLVNGQEKYMIGTESALAENLVSFLIDWQKQPGIADDLVDEYILHEALERTALEHRDIIKLTTTLFGRGSFEETFNARPGETPLGTAIREFIDLKLISSGCEGVLNKARRGSHPSVVVIEVSEGTQIWDGAKYVKLSGQVEKTMTRKYGVNVHVVYSVRGAIDQAVDKVTHLFTKAGNDPLSRVIVFSGEDSYNDFKTGFETSQIGSDRRLAGVVKGNFMPENRTQRFSVVSLAILGLGLMEADRALSDRGSRNERDTEELNSRIKSLLIRMADNPRELEGLNAAELIKKLLNGNILFRIRKHNYEEIRDFMNTEAAVLESA
jgi:hypothetical protein